MEVEACPTWTPGANRGIRIPLGHPPAVFGMPGSHALATQVLGHLGWQEGVCTFKLFGNGEISAKIEQNVTNHDVFVICSRDDVESEVNFAFMQLLFLIDSLKGESPHRLTVIIPCLEYARQDRRMVAGEAIPPKLLLRCMKIAGADRFVVVDLHNPAQAAFSPDGAVLDELSAVRYLADFIRANVPQFSEDQVLVCATDGGGMKFTRRMADELRTGFMMADRFRREAEGDREIRIISDVNIDHIKGIIVVDDMFDTCGSLAGVCEALRVFAPKAQLYGVAIHGYFSGGANLQIKKLVDAGCLEWVAVTNSISQRGALQRFDDLGMIDRLKVVDISRLLAGAIIRIHLRTSVNLSRFRGYGPATHDPVLQEAGLVPPHQYVYVVPGQNEVAGPLVPLKRKSNDWD
mmetsp:Transcript_838/g.2105  ORF Transcript_838/g.2105 Transcript_838/m.2105 type:complete len:405 (+) Transcript_838:87-1301(+)